jgi:hypothetical protein
MSTYDQSAKFDAGKPPYELVQWQFVEGIAAVLAYGAQKYNANSWQTVPQARVRYFAATVRHLLAWWRGEDLDPESGLRHLWHAGCNVMFLASGKLDDDSQPPI